MKYVFNNHLENKYLYLYSGGYEPTKESHVYGPTVRSGYMLHYIHSGEGTFTSGNKQYTLHEGDFFFIEPNKIIKYEASSTNPWAFYWIGFKGILVDDYLKRTSISTFNPVFNIKKGSVIKDKLSEIIEIALIKEDDDLFLNAKLLELFYHLSILFPNREEEERKNRKNILFAQALQYIRNNFESPIEISEIARLLSIDRTYLHRLFKQELGIGPKEYLTDVRIRKAKELLKTTDYPINIISQSVGYEDTQQFAKVFKRIVNTTPSKFRELI